MSPLVLVVDDDPDILDAICDILETEGYRVARARHGLEALDRVELERPAVILLDLMMPVMDGVAFAEALRRSSAGERSPCRSPVAWPRRWAAISGSRGRGTSSRSRPWRRILPARIGSRSP